jgi:hypothetical protein
VEVSEKRPPPQSEETPIEGAEEQMEEHMEQRRTPMNGDDLRRWNPILSTQQEEAVGLMAAGATVTQTADKLGVARQTVSEWRNHHPTFQSALAERRKELWSSVRDRLGSLLSPALDLLERAIRQGNVNAALALVRSIMATNILEADQQQNGVVLNDNRQVVTINRDFDPLKGLTPLQRDQLRNHMQAKILEMRKSVQDK